ncbi:Predicted transglutaminase-like cysteine proteinase [Pleomorphomonas diazotrophica]|nr:transglutaminase-like cysteine peptidase [Pleomorphomonas diazotrophica]SFN11201.1 Predicted transglutaminase-like cysteine proteinase [Pleomorphomonas diazotrophica]
MSAVTALIAGVMAVYTTGPTGFYRMCLDNPSDCRRVAQTRVVPVEEVREINSSVNAAIRPVAEFPGKDEWRVEPRAGDCEDYAITKRHRLIARGIGSANARLATGEFRGDEHAVLVLTLSGRAYVLDNLTNALLPADRSAVRIKTIQSAYDPRMWLKAK